MKNRILRGVVLAVVLITAACTSGVRESSYPSERYLREGWKIQSADSVEADGTVISTSACDTGKWYEARVPGTVLRNLLDNGFWPDIFRDDNLAKVPEEPFRKNWWYRKVFSLSEVPPSLIVHFGGINYRANIWFNGHLVADSSTVVNSFRRFAFDLTKWAVKGENVLAVEVVPPRAGDFTVGFVDWNPEPPDRNMGLFRPVWLESNGGVEVSEPFVATSLEKDHSRAMLTASVKVTNRTSRPVKGEVLLRLEGRMMSQQIGLAPGEERKVLFDPRTYSGLVVRNPKLWWPHTFGTPHLCHAAFSFVEGDKVLDTKKIRFGIRTVSSEMTPEGYRLFRINGKRIQIHGGGWTDRMMLDDTPESVRSQLAYVKDVGLNAIRLEGFWGNSQTLYDLCDSMGILIMAGWSCHWEWPNLLGKPTDRKYGGILTDDEIDMMSEAWKDQVVWLRNHPSVFLWLTGSDLQPKPEAERRYLAVLKEYDTTRVCIGSAKTTTTLAGPTGVKMLGPYAYVPPVYWFRDTSSGGAYGFATEIGPGVQVPPEQSIRKMLSEEHWWPIDTMWNYHCGRGHFGTLDRFTCALRERYGDFNSLGSFERKAQVLNYELMRPMFEAYSARRYTATGIILWMLNSAWPEMYWQLYDYYLHPNAAYYGAKKALRPHHIVYDYDRKALYAVSDVAGEPMNARLRVRIYDSRSNLKYEKELTVTLEPDSSKEVLDVKDLLLPGITFLDTRLTGSDGEEVDRNFYWLSSKEDVVDWGYDGPFSWVHTPSLKYADFRALNTMPPAKVSGKMVQGQEIEQDVRFEVLLENAGDHIAFFVHADIVDQKNGETILPVRWSDNYISLLPHEKRSLTAIIPRKAMTGHAPALKLTGYNLEE